MLAWNARAGPPGAVADIRALPLADDSVDDVVAAFVLNHLTDPSAGLAELARVTRPGGTVLATVFASTSRSAARDRIDTNQVLPNRLDTMTGSPAGPGDGDGRPGVKGPAVVRHAGRNGQAARSGRPHGRVPAAARRSHPHCGKPPPRL